MQNTMKHILITSTIVLAVLSTRAQTTETREIKPFTKIDISGAATVEYMQSDTLQLSVTGDAGDLRNVTTSSDGETLMIKTKGGISHFCRIRVASRGLAQVTCSGASKIESGNTITTDSISIDASGASTVNLNIKNRALNVVSGGASGLGLEGSTSNLTANISDASTLKSYKLSASSVNVITSGASTAKVYAVDRIMANATGASTVKFKGDPKDVSVEASTASTIAKIAGDDSQKKITGRDSTTFNFKKKKFIIINSDKDKKKKSDDDEFHHWAGFSMGINGWLSNAGSFSLPKSDKYMSLNYGKSLNFQLNPFEHDFHIYKNYVNLVTGLGFEWNQYEFSNRVTLNADSSYTAGKVDSLGKVNFRKNRLKTTFVDVPLLLEFNTSQDHNKAFHVALGVIGGYKLGSRTRQIFSQDGNEIKRVRKGDYNINPIRVNAHLSLGYANWTFFADYAITPLFESDKGPALHPFTIGLRIVPF